MKKLNKFFYGLAVVILMWSLLYFTVDSQIIPSPFATIINTAKLAFTSLMLKHLLFSLYRLFAAISLAMIIGSLIGVFLGVHKKIDKFISPIIYILFPIPKAAFLPIIFVLFGLGNASKIILIFLVLFFLIIVQIRDAVKTLSDEVFISAESLGLNKKDIYKHIIFPGIQPSILTTLKLSIGIGIAVLFFAETYATRFGVGYYIMNSWSQIEYINMYSGIILLSVLGFILFTIVEMIEEKYCHWAL